jgi:hypothetical protein
MCENYNVPWSEHPIQQALMACAEELEISMKGYETIVLEAQAGFLHLYMSAVCKTYYGMFSVLPSRAVLSGF